MNKWPIVLVAIFVTNVAAAPNNSLAKSLNQVKRAANLLQPENRRDEDQIDLSLLDTDHDGMLNVDELKALLIMCGAHEEDLDDYIKMLMLYDEDKNQKLDMTEMDNLSKWPRR